MIQRSFSLGHIEELVNISETSTIRAQEGATPLQYLVYSSCYCNHAIKNAKQKIQVGEQREPSDFKNSLPKFSKLNFRFPKLYVNPRQAHSYSFVFSYALLLKQSQKRDYLRTYKRGVAVDVDATSPIRFFISTCRFRYLYAFPVDTI